MTGRRSKFVSWLIVGGAVLSAVVIVVGVIFRGSVDAEQVRVVRGQVAAEYRWEGQAVFVLRSIIGLTLQSLDQPVVQAQATYDSTAGRAPEEVREALRNAIVAARNAPADTFARTDLLADPTDLSVALKATIILTARVRDALLAADKAAQEQAAIFDAAEAKRKADQEAAERRKRPGPQTPDSTDKDATAICLSGRGAQGAIACVKAMAHAVSVSVEWRETGPNTGWSGTTWIEEDGHPLTARVSLSNSIAADFGASPEAISVAMHESGHASEARCHAIADDPVFSQRGSRDDRAERFATAYAIALGAPSRDAAGQSAYGFVSTEEEIAKAGQC